MGKNYYTSDEILRKAEDLGLDLVERKLKYYVTLGILPKPVRNPDDAGEALDGRVAYFPPETLDRLKKIQELQSSGFTLPQIKAYFNRSIDPGLEEFLGSGKGHHRISPEILAKLLLSDDMREAARSFQRKISSDGTEEAFQGAALEYYFETLALLLGEETAKKYVKEFLIDAPSEQKERNIAPLRKWKDYLLRKQKGSFISTALDHVYNQLIEGTYSTPEIMEKLREMAEKVNVLQNKYKETGRVLGEAFEISKYMRQIFWVYLKSLLEIENFLKDKKKDHLKRARILYYKADEMLNSMEDLIGVIKNMVKLYEDIENL